MSNRYTLGLSLPVPSPTPSPSLDDLLPPPSGEDVQQPTESAPMESEPVESLSVSPPEPDQPRPAGANIWMWIAFALAALLVLLAAAVAVRSHGKKKKERTILSSTIDLNSPFPQTDSCPIAVGKVHEQGGRDAQQDSFSVSPAELYPTHGLLAAVADGMGGLADGDRVSQTAIAAMMDGFCALNAPSEQALPALLEQANRAVNDLLGPAGLRKSGSTLVAGLIRDGRFHYLSVGDSRICLYRNGILRQLNREHIYRSELYLQAINGEISFHTALSDPAGKGLSSFLGMGRLQYIDLPAQPEQALPGDKFILMSDGVYNAISDVELTRALAGDAASAAEAIRSAVLAKGYPDQDNFTAVILECLTPGGEREHT